MHVTNIGPESTHFGKLMFHFVKICKVSEIRTPWWFRTLRSTSPSKTTAGNTFLGFRKLVTNFLSAFPEDSLLVWRLKSTRSPSGRQSQRHRDPGEWVVVRSVGEKNTRRLCQTQNFDKLFVVFYRQALSSLLLCFVPVLRECSKHLLVRIRSFYKFLQNETLISRNWSDVSDMHS